MAQTLELKYPIQWKGSPDICELKFRRLHIGDLKAVKNPTDLSVSEIIELISKSTGIDEPKCERIDLSDMVEVQKIIHGFLQGSP